MKLPCPSRMYADAEMLVVVVAYVGDTCALFNLERARLGGIERDLKPAHDLVGHRGPVARGARGLLETGRNTYKRDSQSRKKKIQYAV